MGLSPWKDAMKISEKISDEILGARTGKLLESLGETPGEVAEALYQQGIKGARGFAGRCPLANFLREKCKAPAFVGPGVYWVKGAGKSFDLPKPCTQFIHEFDSGRYSRLHA